MTRDRSYFTKHFIEENLHVLSSENSRIITLYFLEQKSQKEIAKELSYTIPKAKTKIAKAVLELRKLANDPNYLKAMEILNGN